MEEKSYDYDIYHKPWGLNKCLVWKNNVKKGRNTAYNFAVQKSEYTRCAWELKYKPSSALKHSADSPGEGCVIF